MADPFPRASATARETILVVDDDPMMVDLLIDLLSREFEVVGARGGEEALKALRAREFGALIIDQMMPGMTGVDLLKEALALRPEATRIMVTATDRLDDARDAINVGRVDRFVSKPIRPMELLAIVKGALREASLERERSRLLDELKHKNEALESALTEVREHERKLEDEVVRRTRELRQLVKRLEEMALKDGLTGLYNHRFFQETLNAEMSRANRYGRKLSLLFIDVDHFKDYNDGHGHLAGDELLKQLGKILSNTGAAPDVKTRGRLSDVACRYGGEEFVVLLPEADKAGAQIRAERLRAEVADYPFTGREKQPLGLISVSVGVAGFPDDGKTKQDLIHAADEAMLRAKRDGRNRVILAGS